MNPEVGLSLFSALCNTELSLANALSSPPERKARRFVGQSDSEAPCIAAALAVNPRHRRSEVAELGSSTGIEAVEPDIASSAVQTCSAKSVRDSSSSVEGRWRQAQIPSARGAEDFRDMRASCTNAQQPWAFTSDMSAQETRLIDVLKISNSFSKSCR